MDNVVLITSTYNGEKYLPSMLDGILAQTYENITLFVRDDGSSDSSLELLRTYRERFENAPGHKSILILNETDGDYGNKGSHQSYRYVMANMPDAPYYLFCDQDDVWLPDKVERAVSSMSTYPADVPVLYVHNYYVCDQDLNIEREMPERESITPSVMKSVDLCHVIMTGTWGGVGMSQGFNRTLKKLAFDSGDITPSVAVDCWISWVVAGFNGALIYDKKPLAYYRRHPGTFSSGDANGLARYRDWIRHIDRHTANIVNGIRDYNRLYASRVSRSRSYFLRLFSGKDRLRKLFYHHRLRKSVLDEAAFRTLILIGKI